MKYLSAFDGWLKKSESALLILLFGVMMVLAFAQVVLREAFSSGFIWADILLRHLVLWIGFLGGALATANNRHIHIDALAHYISERTRAAIGVLTNLFGAAVCVLLYQASMTFIRGEIEANSVVFENIPAWYAQLIIPVGFGLHIAHFLVHSVLSGAKAMQKEIPA
jgi:TRAP-type C4-dicarboxylate transport system permease small subunit